MKSFSKDILILGGGISGLSIGYHLKKKGISFSLIEKEKRLGGVIQSVHEKGFLLERGPNSLLNTHPHLEEMVKDLGLEKDICFAHKSAKNRFIVKQGRLIPMPLGPFSFLTTSLFSWKTKIGLCREPFVPRGPKGESLADFVKRRLGEEFLDYAINPFVAGVYAATPENLSLEYGFPKLFQLEQDYGSLIRGALLKRRKKDESIPKDRAKIFSFHSGLEQLPKRLEEYLKPDLFLNTEIFSMEKIKPHGFRIQGKSEGESFEWKCQVLILAIPAYQYKNLPWKWEAPSFMKEIPYAPMAMVFLGYKNKPKGHPLNGYGCLVPEKENRKILGILFNSSLFPNRAPKGGALLTVFLGGSRSPEIAGLSEDELVKIAEKEAEELLEFPTSPDVCSAWKVPYAIPQYDLHHGSRILAIQSYEAKHPGVFFTGNFRDGISLSDCLLKGREWAQKVEEEIKKRK